MKADRKPLARSERLIVEELGDEVLVYDLDEDKVHCLTPLATRVWRACDGSTDTLRLAATLELTGDEVSQALTELDRCGLIETPPVLPLSANGDGGYSRRAFGLRVAKVAAATASAPLILTIAAPAAAQTQSEIDFCLAIDVSRGCGDCNDGGTAGGPCCCCQPGGGSTKVCAASLAHCQSLGGNNCTEKNTDDPAPTSLRSPDSATQTQELSPSSSSTSPTGAPPAPAPEPVVPTPPTPEPVAPPTTTTTTTTTTTAAPPTAP